MSPPGFMNEEEINKLYERLPEKSKGRLADNPKRFYNFFNSKVLDPDAWPYIVLCKDQENRSLTWHMFCDRVFFHSLVSGVGREIYEFDASVIRKRSLKFVEVHTREGEHYFLD